MPLQLAATAHAARFNAHICSSAPLSSAPAQAMSHRVFMLLDTLHFEVVPVPPLATLPPHVECATLLAFQQLALGCALPLVLQAVWEARQHAAHHAERRAAGLPLERGLQATLLGTVAGVADACNLPALVAMSWISLGILWDVALWASGGGKSVTVA